MRSLQWVLLLAVTAQLALGQDSVKTTQEPPKGRFSGYMFGDFFYNVDQRDTAKKDLSGFQFRRIYFTYDYAISSSFDTRFRLEADQTALTSDGKIGVFVKDAYLKWKGVFTGSDLLVGVSPTPAFDASEDAWGYRSLEKTIMDLRGIVPSRDLGVDLKGKLTGDGVVNYWLKVGNNSGNKPESDKFKRYYGQLHFKPSAQLQLVASADFDAESNVTDTLDGTSKSSNRVVASAFANYRQPNSYSFGVEAFYRATQNGYRASAPEALANQKSFGVTLFAWGALAEELRLVGRFDYYDPNTSVDRDGVSLLIAGLDYLPSPDVHIMPNIYVQDYQADVANDLVGRVTFFYTFR